jgi:predicted permease
MRPLFDDIRYVTRSLLKSPGLTFVATLALTLGIGLTTAMFSIVYGILLKGLPYPGGDRVVVIQRENPARGVTHQNPPIQDYIDYRAQLHSVIGVAAFTSGTMYVGGTENPERVDGSRITANTFDVLGVRPFLGRPFREGEDSPSGGNVALLAYDVWRERYSSDPDVTAKQIRVNGAQYQIIGVLPNGFAFPNNDKIWLPLQADPVATNRVDGPYVTVFAKLKPGVSLDQASVEAASVASRLASEYPASNAGFTASVETFIDSLIGKQRRQLLYTMLGAVFFVLLIACANVANLLLDRAAHRTREIGVRIALGASRAAVMRLFLAESLVLSVTATAGGIVVAQSGVWAFNRVLTMVAAAAGGQVKFFVDIGLHPPVLAFTILVAMTTTLIAGALPAIQSARADIHDVLKDESRGASGFRVGRISHALVIVEVALSCGLLVGAGLMIKSVVHMQKLDPGFTTRNVFIARVGFPSGYLDTTTQWQFFDQARERVSALPGVKAAALASGLPAVAKQGLSNTPFAVEGQTYVTNQDYPTSDVASVTPSFFSVLAIPVLSGRAFTVFDRPGSPSVVVVTRAFAMKFLKGRDPIGRRIQLGGAQSTAPWSTIVGVVGDVFAGHRDDPKAPAIFQPFAQARTSFASIAARTTGPPMSITQSVREAVAGLNADIPVFWVQSLDAAIANQLWFVRIFGTMFIIFGFVALFLAALGLYAVMSFAVSRRTREIGIRMALGAQGRDVLRMISRQGLWQLGTGIAAGLALAAAIANRMSVVLFEVEPRDPLILCAVIAVLAVVGLVACLVPATRATRIDPLVAFRSE